tara:strand:+ start:1450 stop:1614 length:165 start_codon:yes stop_codon:yes gene_type:complete
MKKVFIIAAVVLMNVGFYSCDNSSNADDSALYENLDTNGGDGDATPPRNGSGGN